MFVCGGAVCGFWVVTTAEYELYDGTVVTDGAAVAGVFDVSVTAVVCVSLGELSLSDVDSVSDVDDTVVSELVGLVVVDDLVVVVAREESSCELSLRESSSDDESSCDESSSATECFCR